MTACDLLVHMLTIYQLTTQIRVKPDKQPAGRACPVPVWLCGAREEKEASVNKRSVLCWS